jgi:excisionase family DNA binding protein
MINDHIVQRRNGEDRRKKRDRRSGFDRRNESFANGFDENGQENVYTTIEACEYLKISRPTYLKYIAEGYTTIEACEYLKISRPTYLKYIAEGRIKAIKVGRGWRTLKTELDRFLRGE